MPQHDPHPQSPSSLSPDISLLNLTPLDLAKKLPISNPFESEFDTECKNLRRKRKLIQSSAKKLLEILSIPEQSLGAPAN